MNVSVGLQKGLTFLEFLISDTKAMDAFWSQFELLLKIFPDDWKTIGRLTKSLILAHASDSHYRKFQDFSKTHPELWSPIDVLFNRQLLASKLYQNPKLARMVLIDDLQFSGENSEVWLSDLLRELSNIHRQVCQVMQVVMTNFDESLDGWSQAHLGVQSFSTIRTMHETLRQFKTTAEKTEVLEVLLASLQKPKGSLHRV